tara:strand:+ start:45 stop:218 length:174 start_codon:yes stop_codon:yes gene_type:complete
MELIQFNKRDYDIEDIKTSKNLNRIQSEEIIRLNKLTEDYRNELLNILENRKYWIKQ